MTYDFDRVTNRQGTDSLKYDAAGIYNKPEGLIPMWVADMDFPTAQPILDALHTRVTHGIFGYTLTSDDYLRAVCDWQKRRHGWNIRPEWIVQTPGVVYAIATAIRALTKKGDGVLIQPPVYYPFKSVIEDNGRKAVLNPLIYKDGQYIIDFDDMERKIVDWDVKLFILCSPHNPVGRVWKRNELRRIAEICMRRDVIIISDEIHSEFVWDNNTHWPLASINQEIEDITITCTSPSKTFNLAGLQISDIIIPSPEMRKKFEFELRSVGYMEMNTLGLTAAYAAYTQGEEWLDQLNKYIKGNIDYIKEFVEKEMPMVKFIQPEGTYLVWLDLNELDLTECQREELILNRGGLWLDSGAMFGENGYGFERINVACPRSVLTEAMNKARTVILGYREYLAEKDACRQGEGGTEE